jgi:hypothetical protein
MQGHRAAHVAGCRTRSAATVGHRGIRATSPTVDGPGLWCALQTEGSGKSNNEIARDLSLSPNTVANHVAGILAKLHVENRIQAAVEAVRSGIS